MKTTEYSHGAARRLGAAVLVLLVALLPLWNVTDVRAAEEFGVSVQAVPRDTAGDDVDHGGNTSARAANARIASRRNISEEISLDAMEIAATYSTDSETQVEDTVYWLRTGLREGISLHNNYPIDFELAWSAREEENFFQPGDYFSFPVVNSEHFQSVTTQRFPLKATRHNGQELEIGYGQFSCLNGQVYYTVTLTDDIIYFHLTEGEANGSVQLTADEEDTAVDIVFGEDDHNTLPLIQKTVGGNGTGVAKAGAVNVVKAEGIQSRSGSVASASAYNAIEGLEGFSFEVFLADNDGDAVGSALYFEEIEGGYRLVGSNPTSNGQISRLKTGGDGRLCLSFEDVDTKEAYVLREVWTSESPEGYYIDQNNAVSIAPSMNNATYYAVYNQPRTVRLTKVDEDNSATKLSGAEFTLFSEGESAEWTGFQAEDDGVYRYTGTGSNSTLTTGSNGLLEIIGLPAGDYVLKETKPPEGYEGEASFAFSLEDSIADAGTGVVSTTVTNKKTGSEPGPDPDNLQLRIIKLGVNGTTETRLPGVSFTLTKEGTNASVSITTDTNGTRVIQFEDNPKGTYQLTETAPSGYRGIGTITLTLKEDGSIEGVQGLTEDVALVSHSGNTLTVRNIATGGGGDNTNNSGGGSSGGDKPNGGEYRERNGSSGGGSTFTPTASTPAPAPSQPIEEPEVPLSAGQVQNTTTMTIDNPSTGVKAGLGIAVAMAIAAGFAAVQIVRRRR